MADQLSGGAKCVKYTLFLFNMLFLLAGLALIIVGAIVLVHTKDISFSSSAGPAGIFIIVVGGIVFLVSFFGCAGAINNNYCMVITYGLLLILLLIAEVAGVITGFVLKDKIRDKVLEEMQDTMKNYNEATPNPDTDAWNKTQTDFECCGIDGYLSWVNGSKAIVDSQSVPDSCCTNAHKGPGCGYGRIYSGDAKERFYDEGCYDKLKDHLKYYLIALGAVAASVAFIELIGILMAFCLASHLRKDYRVV